MKPVFVTLNIAIVAVAAFFFSNHQNAQARSALAQNIPGVTLGDLPLERGFNFTVNTGTLPQQQAQGAFGFHSTVAVMEGPVQSTIGIVLTGVSTMQATNAQLKSLSIMINGGIVYTGSAEPVTGVFKFNPILVRPGSFLRIEAASSQALTIQGYTVDASDLALP